MPKAPEGCGNWIPSLLSVWGLGFRVSDQGLKGLHHHFPSKNMIFLAQWALLMGLSMPGFLWTDSARVLVHGWDSIKYDKFYSFLGLCTRKNVICYPTMPKSPVSCY